MKNASRLVTADSERRPIRRTFHLDGIPQTRPLY